VCETERVHVCTHTWTKDDSDATHKMYVHVCVCVVCVYVCVGVWVGECLCECVNIFCGLVGCTDTYNQLAYMS